MVSCSVSFFAFLVMSSMQNVELRDYPKDGEVSTAGIDDLSDSDLQQVEGKNYDPTPDKRDMRRLGKRQELKVRNIATNMVKM